MPIRNPKTTSPGRRFVTYLDNSELTKSEPEKSLVEGLTKSGGRNAHGRKTSRHRGGGAKRLYRKIDFKRRKDGVPAKVAAIEYDPNRSSYIALTPGRGGQMGRSAGTAIQLLAKDAGMATLRLPSGEVRMVRAECRATVGTIGNADHQNVTIGKAGRKRHLGVRPQTRGTAMNPVDHPHGGGEGSTTAGRHPVTPWGVPTLGYRTRKKNKASDRFIVRRRRRGKGKR